MKISALNENERLALLGLLKMVIQADRKVSPEEIEQLNKLAAEMGPDKWNASKQLAMDRFKDLNEIRAFAEVGVERQAARELIYELLKDMANADEQDPMEESVMRWIARVWNIR